MCHFNPILRMMDWSHSSFAKHESTLSAIRVVAFLMLGVAAWPVFHEDSAKRTTDLARKVQQIEADDGLDSSTPDGDALRHRPRRCSRMLLTLPAWQESDDNRPDDQPTVGHSALLEFAILHPTSRNGRAELTSRTIEPPRDSRRLTQLFCILQI